MLYWLLGFEDEVENADERQKHLKHLLCRQIEESKLKLNKVKFNEEVYEMETINNNVKVNNVKRKVKQYNKKIRTKTITV